MAKSVLMSPTIPDGVAIVVLYASNAIRESVVASSESHHQARGELEPF